MYDIELKNIWKGIGFYAIFFFSGALFLLPILLPLINVIETEPDAEFTLMFLLLPGVFMIVGGLGIANVFKRVKQIKRLNQVGILYKNIPYDLVPTGMTVNGVDILKPIVKFKLPNGELVSLAGDARHDRITRDGDGYIDLVLDPENYDNYFLDYDINRMGGNRPEDFYKSLEELKRDEENKYNNVQNNNSSNNSYKYPNDFSFGKYDNSNDGRPYKPL